MLRAKAVVENATEPGADGAADGEDDSEQAKLGGAPSEYGRRVDAAKGKDGAKPVGVQHACEEEAGDLGVIADEALHALDIVLQPCPHLLRLELATRRIGREKEER